MSVYSSSRANRNDYVYEKKAGEGVFVYIIDSGVQVNVKDVSAGGFVSTTSPDRRNDFSSNGHGTKVGSKVQSTWGIAKKATIIPVQTLSDSPDDLTFGFNEVYRDLRRRRAASAGSELKSVSTTLLRER
jgi:subtilisin family serine protease